MSEELLKPCPFCGCEARHFAVPDEHKRISYGVQCSGSACHIAGPERGSQEEAATAWNRRTSPGTIHAQTTKIEPMAYLTVDRKHLIFADRVAEYGAGSRATEGMIPLYAGSASTTSEAGKLPPLPTPASGERVYTGNGNYEEELYYTADQMRVYARAASTRTASDTRQPELVMRALEDAREVAMKNTVAARVPECGDFGAIAQNLDWAIEEIKRNAPASDTRTAALEEAAKACESEVVENSGLLEQEAHNYAVKRCAALIRAQASAAGEAECDAALGRAAPAGQHEARESARRLEITQVMLEQERVKNAHLLEVLMSIYRLSPRGEDIKLPDGRVFRFNDPNSAETLNALGRAIHAIPEKCAKALATRSRAEGGNTQDTACSQFPNSESRTMPRSDAEVDVEAECVKQILYGIDQTEFCDAGWWETSAGAQFGAKKLAELLDYLAARTQTDAGKADTERLDWLEAHCTGASDSERYLPFRIYWGNKGATKGIRAQIDKARAATTKPENT